MGGMFSGWDANDFVGWGLVVVVLLITAAAVTYLVRSWTGGSKRRREERAELERLRALHSESRPAEQ